MPGDVDILTPERVNGLKELNPKCAIYVAAEAFYRDIFKRKRMTQVLLVHSPADTVALIESEESNRSMLMQARFVSAHVLNHFT